MNTRYQYVLQALDIPKKGFDKFSLQSHFDRMKTHQSVPRQVLDPFPISKHPFSIP